MTAFLADALHWSLIVAGAFLTIAVVSLPFCRWLGRRLGSMTTTDPEEVAAHADSFRMSAHEQREG